MVKKCKRWVDYGHNLLATRTPRPLLTLTSGIFCHGDRWSGPAVFDSNVGLAVFGADSSSDESTEMLILVFLGDTVAGLVFQMRPVALAYSFDGSATAPIEDDRPGPSMAAIKGGASIAMGRHFPPEWIRFAGRVVAAACRRSSSCRPCGRSTTDWPARHRWAGCHGSASDASPIAGAIPKTASGKKKKNRVYVWWRYYDEASHSSRNCAGSVLAPLLIVCALVSRVLFAFVQALTEKMCFMNICS